MPCPARSPNCCAARRSRTARSTFAWKAAVGPALERVDRRQARGRRAASSKPRARSGRAKSSARRRVILPRLQTLLGAGRRRRESRSATRSREVDAMREVRHRQRRPHADRQVPRRAQGLHRARSSARWSSPKPCAAPASIPAIVDECIMGNVVSAGLGQNPARQAALSGGLPDHVAALTINKVCGSGLKAVMLADQGIARRRHRRRRRRRHGVDEQLPVPAAARARRAAHGQRRARRLDDQRRPVVRVRAVPHGQLRRGRRRALPRRPRRAGRRTPRAATRRRRARPTTARSRTRSCRSSIPQKKGDAARRRSRRVDPRRHDRRGARAR